jgi:hypothetical protein
VNRISSLSGSLRLIKAEMMYTKKKKDQKSHQYQRLVQDQQGFFSKGESAVDFSFNTGRPNLQILDASPAAFPPIELNRPLMTLGEGAFCFMSFVCYTRVQ